MAVGRDAADVALTTNFGRAILKKFFIISDESPPRTSGLVRPRGFYNGPLSVALLILYWATFLFSAHTFASEKTEHAQLLKDSGEPGRQILTGSVKWPRLAQRVFQESEQISPIRPGRLIPSRHCETVYQEEASSASI